MNRNLNAPDITLSIIIVNFNSGDLLKNCLVSLLSQMHLLKSVIVIDNASKDDSMKCIPVHENIDLIYSSSNLGFSTASNVAVNRCSSADWVVMLNPDTVVDRDFVPSVLRAISCHPGYSSYACRMMSLNDPSKIDGLGDGYHLSGRPRRRFHGAEFERTTMPKVEEVFSACGGAAVYNRRVFQSLGGFDENFFCYLEDVDLGFRFQLQGHKCLFVRDAVVHHVGSAIAGLHSNFQIYHAHRNLEWAYFKNMPIGALLLTLPLHLLLNVWTIMLFCFRGKFGIIMRAKYDALKSITRVMQQRHQCAGVTKLSSMEILKILNWKFK